MNKYLPYAFIGFLVIVAVVFVSGRLNTKNSLPDTTQSEVVMTDTSPSPIPVSEVVLNDRSEVNEAIDAELNQMDKELKGINDTNLDASGLSDKQLGL
jgi:primosomal replication protein N